MRSPEQLRAAHCRPLEGHAALSSEKVIAQLAALPQWQLVDGAIRRSYRFTNYFETIAFVNALAWKVHREDHHPDLVVGYDRCEVRSRHPLGRPHLGQRLHLRREGRRDLRPALRQRGRMSETARAPIMFEARVVAGYGRHFLVEDGAGLLYEAQRRGKRDDVEAIANKGGSEEIYRPLHLEETRKKALVAKLTQLDAMAETVSLDEKRIVQTLRARLGDVPALFGRHVPLARQMLRRLLDGHISCEPIMDGETRGYRFTATGTFDRVLTGVKVVNESGGGQGS